MFETVLIANRGEIAVRIERTLRRLGVRSVAVYTDADGGSRHVSEADVAVNVGAGPVATSYLDGRRIIDAALATGADAVHPGYGFLSEYAGFAEACASAGLVWVGPRPEHLRRFGEKHEARLLARRLGIPLLAGSELLVDLDAALAEANRIGYPVMLKATAGGGGIGMQRCDDPGALRAAFGPVARLARQHFGQAGLFAERLVTRARHVEVQLFGTAGGISALGDRDCSAQRRHQKVIEEAPAPGLPHGLRDQLRSWALVLADAVGYRSAGTVEFLVDAVRLEAAFLEVNTRLQVEHRVTEGVYGIDLVEWMLREAAGEMVAPPAVTPRGHAIEVRVYAEDPAHGYRPGSGVVSGLRLPDAAQVDTWIEPGVEVTTLYDALLAKVIVTGSDRASAVAMVGEAVGQLRIEGMATNAELLAAAVAHPQFVAGAYTTGFLAGVEYRPPTIEVLAPGMQTTVQDHPGRLGYWAVGVPPSGPMDDHAFRVGNHLLGNDPRAAGLEITVTGPVLRFDADATFALTGAPMDADLDGRPVPWWAPVEAAAGATLRIGGLTGAGCRAYLQVRGGIDVPPYLGSRATFLLGGFGGHAGRALTSGDVLRFGAEPRTDPAPTWPPAGGAPPVPTYAGTWEILVADGPHGAPDFITGAGIDALYAAEWEVHHHSDRTGVRLIGPAPEWSRPDGGEAGLHPSNIHDTTYAVGTVDFTGDMPVILGPDGPSLGGFVCPFTVVTGERWKLGQLRAGDRVRFRPATRRADPVLRRLPAGPSRPEATYRRAGDSCVLVEYGPNVLDLELRLRAHALSGAITAHGVAGVEELAPGIRCLQVRFDPSVIDLDQLVDSLGALEAALPPAAGLVVPSRVVHLPLSWDDPATREAIERYMRVVRDDAPWCPWNIEFIRRVNGLDDVDDVRTIFFAATYLVLGLGDVYLGAPVATPLDPRHRLVTTKYNPARTWTPENAVGIGGAYLCVYGMEGPGGYQFVGRTVPVWSPYRGDERCVLRCFDQLRFFPVEAGELLALRRAARDGRYQVATEETLLRFGDHQRLLAEEAESIAAFKARQQAAFTAERARWEATGELGRAAAAGRRATESRAVGEAPIPPGCLGTTTPVAGVVAHVASPGARVAAGAPLLVVEAMKSETAVPAPVAGEVVEVRCQIGQAVGSGVTLVVIRPLDPS